MDLGDVFNLMFEGLDKQTKQFNDLQEAIALLKETARVLADLASLISESRGVAGYHGNGDEAEWAEFEEFSEISGLLERIDNLHKPSDENHI